MICVLGFGRFAWYNGLNGLVGAWLKGYSLQATSLELTMTFDGRSDRPSRRAKKGIEMGRIDIAQVTHHTYSRGIA